MGHSDRRMSDRIEPVLTLTTMQLVSDDDMPPLLETETRPRVEEHPLYGLDLSDVCAVPHVHAAWLVDLSANAVMARSSRIDSRSDRVALGVAGRVRAEVYSLCEKHQIGRPEESVMTFGPECQMVQRLEGWPSLALVLAAASEGFNLALTRIAIRKLQNRIGTQVEFEEAG